VYASAANVQANMMTLWSFNLHKSSAANDLDGKKYNAAYDGFYALADKCKNNTCASEHCLTQRFMEIIQQEVVDKALPQVPAPGDKYEQYMISHCQPQYCDVARPKSSVTRVVDFLSTLGGLWPPLLLGATIAWVLMLAMFPCLTDRSAWQHDKNVRVEMI
jgi:hypothetical protein